MPKITMEESKLDNYLSLAKKAVTKVGEIIEAEKRKGYRVIRKEKNELVTELDVLAQARLIDLLKEEAECRTFIAEEKRILDLPENDFWVIDPIDGTHNFIAGLPFYSVSLAYFHKGILMLSAVYFPESRDLYYAQKGKGAFCNNALIRISSNKDLAKGIVAYDNQFYLTKNSLANFIEIQKSVFTTRILGVASRDACFVAEGVLDARIWNSTKLCDIAAGSLIVEEAGGRVSDFSGKPLDFHSVKDVIASSGKFHGDLIKILNHEDNND
ncbi:MAG: inositol monophosphatase [Candidatus Omnitrophica bacterium]|nr:inositol monophosphatase [Candidatus Omnitrophota bacterium]